ncbi:MAG: DNA-binding protein WhiA, partial [Anaerovoracaceae bacterium]
MSFTSETKAELARVTLKKKCCMLAEIAGFIRICGSVGLMGFGKFKIVMTTDNPAIARHYKMLIKEYFSVDVTLEVGQGTGLKKGNYYILTIGDSLAELILRETGILMIREGMNFISDGIYSGIVKSKCDKKAYLRGLFLGAGIVTNPEKEYHFEIVCQTETLANDVRKLLNSFVDITAKSVARKKEFVVYVKESSQIVDILAIMGASNQIFKYENVKITKEIRNAANRINNCDQANIDKAVAAAEKHIANIKILDQAIGIDNLPDKLKEVAYLRLENPDVSLVELGEMLNPPLKKSGVNKRLLKIAE